MVLITHLRKTAVGRSWSRDVLSDIRGSSEIRAIPDFVWSNVKIKRTNKFIFTNEKQRGAKDGQKWEIEAEIEDGDKLEDGTAEFTLLKEVEEKETQMEALLNDIKEWVTENNLTVFEKGELLEAFGDKYPEGTINNTLTEAKKIGELASPKVGLYSIYTDKIQSSQRKLKNMTKKQIKNFLNSSKFLSSQGTLGTLETEEED
jgi:hypothetical protein